MAKIRHLASKAEDQERTAAFYKETFGMTEAWRGDLLDRRLYQYSDPAGARRT